jgi:hypothetical protein
MGPMSALGQKQIFRGAIAMSALGQKRTYAVQKGTSALPPIATAKADFPQKVMSALPPKADMCFALAYVCFGPIADIPSVDYLFGRVIAPVKSVGRVT